MQIENHVLSLETCKRMKELGWKQGYDNAYVWDKNPREKWELYVLQENYDVYHIGSDCIAAPLLSEILEALPAKVKDGHIRFGRDVEMGEWDIDYALYNRGETTTTAYGKDVNPAEAAALLWCKLVEEGIIPSNEKE